MQRWRTSDPAHDIDDVVHRPAAVSTRRSVPVGVLVPCSGSKAIEATLARR
jgi:hypothetical protein